MAELLGRGAKLAVMAKNNAGATPLHLAAKLGHLRIARELLAVGARADAKDAVRHLSNHRMLPVQTIQALVQCAVRHTGMLVLFKPGREREWS